jgi:hypothetical protein
MRYRFTGYVREVAGHRHFSLEIDPGASLVFANACPPKVVVRIADDSPIANTRGLRDSLVTCSVSNPRGFPLEAQVWLEDRRDRFQ